MTVKGTYLFQYTRSKGIDTIRHCLLIFGQLLSWPIDIIHNIGPLQIRLEIQIKIVKTRSNQSLSITMNYYTSQSGIFMMSYHCKKKCLTWNLIVRYKMGICHLLSWNKMSHEVSYSKLRRLTYLARNEDVFPVLQNKILDWVR